MASEQDVKRYTRSRLLWLAASKNGKALFADLRRGIGKSPGDDPKLWGSFLCGMPEGMLGRKDEPSYAEWAVYTALTLFALHQQGRDPERECMYAEDVPFGSAVARLVEDADRDLDRVTRRFNDAATSADMKEMAYYLRGIVQLLRSKGIPLDYAGLAGDLFRFQFPEGAQNVRLKWGRDFYRALRGKGEGQG